MTIAGGLAEVDRGGPAFNMIPKTGGNTFSGTYFSSFAGEWAQSSNIDDELRAVGFDDLPALIRRTGTPTSRSAARCCATASGSSATSARSAPTRTRPAGTRNLNAGTPSIWSYAKDET